MVGLSRAAADAVHREVRRIVTDELAINLNAE
jgi:hypothetical protein